MKSLLSLVAGYLALLALAHADSRIAVLPLDNRANVQGREERSNLAGENDYVDRASLVIREEVETWLSQQPGVKVMERKDLDKLLKELDLQNASGLVAENTSIPYGQLKGVNCMVGGTILKISRKASNFKGYGVASTKETYSLRFRLKFMDVGKGELGHSGNYSVTIPALQTSNASNENSDIFGDLAEKVTEQLDGDEKLKDFLDGLAKPRKAKRGAVKAAEADDSDSAPAAADDAAAVPAEKVEVKIDPSPDNCDIEIGGVSVGTSPVKTKLPEGRQVIIRITKQGYLPWQQRVKVTKDLKLSPELVKPKPPEKPTTIIVVPKG